MLTLRLIYYIARAALVAGSMVATGWFLAVPPSDSERRMLSANSTTADARLRDAVTELRLAQAALTLAPDLAVSLLHKQLGGRVSRAQIEQGLRTVAAGRAINGAVQPEDAQQRQAGGAKFLSAPGG